MKSPLLARGGVLIKLDRERVLLFTMQSTWQLVQRYGMHFIAALYIATESEVAEPAEGEEAVKTVSVELKDMDALLFFLWVGLQTEAEAVGETLTLEQAAEFITPYTLPTVFNAVVTALMRDVQSAPQPGKGLAAPSSPDPAAKKHPGTTSTKRNARHSPAAGQGRSSGRLRPAS